MRRRYSGLVSQAEHHRVRYRRQRPRCERYRGAHTFVVSLVDDEELRVRCAMDGGGLASCHEHCRVCSGRSCGAHGPPHHRLTVDRYELFDTPVASAAACSEDDGNQSRECRISHCTGSIGACTVALKA